MNGTEYVSRSLSRLRCWPCRISAPWLIAFRTVPTMMATTSDLVRMREENTVLAAFQSIQPPLIPPETFRRSPTNTEYTGIGKLFDPGGHPVSASRRQRREIEGQSGQGPGSPVRSWRLLEWHRNYRSSASGNITARS